ncbi:hypothetical protein BDV95DRAFT_158712 [Massariosphaeria phaeospora]|uniref:Uncharacterized protein n=1 Tax=Massariosphaeria phaeospora TaxID=100035 RepID=A0A7C8I392_9PLEO|nr:hypothetical protein BDV95DRAFT_158712 [Massariosphaeria phaeospora]
MSGLRFTGDPFRGDASRHEGAASGVLPTFPTLAASDEQTSPTQRDPPEGTNSSQQNPEGVSSPSPPIPAAAVTRPARPLSPTLPPRPPYLPPRPPTPITSAPPSTNLPIKPKGRYESPEHYERRVAAANAPPNGGNKRRASSSPEHHEAETAALLDTPFSSEPGSERGPATVVAVPEFPGISAAQKHTEAKK